MWQFRLLFVVALVIQDTILDWFSTSTFGQDVPWVIIFVAMDIVVLCVTVFGTCGCCCYDDDNECCFVMECLSWLLYSATLTFKVGVFYTRHQTKDISPTPGYYSMANNHNQNWLTVGLSLTCVIVYFYVLMIPSSVTKENVYQSRRKAWSIIHGMQAALYLDLMDAIQLLELVNDPSGAMMEFGLYNAVLGVAGFNLILPTVPLMMPLLTSHYECGKRCAVVSKIVYGILVNGSMIAVRSVVWYQYNQSVSVFLAKNLIVIVFAVKELLACCCDSCKTSRKHLYENVV